MVRVTIGTIVSGVVGAVSGFFSGGPVGAIVGAGVCVVGSLSHNGGVYVEGNIKYLLRRHLKCLHPLVD
jgi:hypothetical protein